MAVEIKTGGMRHVMHRADICIVGGGLSGMVAAISAAREGAHVVLMQDRPMFGGNASSEIRMWVRGAKGLCNRETGIISELEEENIYRNPELVYSLWDSVMYEKVKAEPNIEALLNCSCVDADMNGTRIVCVKGWQLTTYTWHTVYADYFADCSGDSVLATPTGALWRVGREGNAEFGETIGPEKADRKTMGMSCLLQARQVDHPVKFIPPSFAYVYESDEDFVPRKGISAASTGADFGYKHVARDAKQCSRDHKLATSGVNFWWLELGGEDDSIADTEQLRDELLKIAFGIWDHIKNHGDHGADDWELEWVGFLPGKRESRRYVGDHILTQNDVDAGGVFDDVVAYGGWPMDDHNPAGFRSRADQPASLLHPSPSPYGIPYRCLYSKNIDNLFFAGRNISATHAAISSTRVMATCSLLGQAMGIAAAMCAARGISPRALYTGGLVPELQAKLMDTGCFIPRHARAIPALTRVAQVNLAESDRAILFNGLERPDADGTVNYITLPKGGDITFRFSEKTALSELRLVFDLDFSRESVSVNKKMRVFAQKANTGSDFRPMTVAKTLVKAFRVFADGNLVYSTDKNHNSLVRIPLSCAAEELRVVFDETWGQDGIHLFSCDVK